MSEVTIRVGVGAIILKGGKILLGIRNVDDNKGKWELLGGLIKPTETLEDAIKREVMEEAGIKIEPEVIVAHYDRYFEDREIRNIGFCFRCKYINGTPHKTEFGRVADFQWAEPEDAFQLDLTPYSRIQLEQYRGWLKQID